MKLPFSYNVQSFKAVLLGSVAIHAVAFGFGRSFILSPHYAVERAASSMDLVILEDVKPDTRKADLKKTLFQVNSKRSKFQAKEEEIQEAGQIRETVSIPPEKGAFTKAKADYLKNPAPRYPNLARLRGWEGTVLLRVLVGKNGGVTKMEVITSSGYIVLDRAASKAVRRWQFLPARVGNLKFSSWVDIPVQFVLKDS
jgi:TonB family protein